MKNVVKALAVVGTMLFANAASAGSIYWGGDFCQASSPSDAANITYNSDGFHNSNPSAAVNLNVSCPIPDTRFITNARVVGYNRNASHSIACTIYALNSSGTVAFSGASSIASAAAGLQNGNLLSFGSVSAMWKAQCSIYGADSLGVSGISSFYLNN